MFGLISMKMIRTDFDGAMAREGYVRTKVMAQRWGMTVKQVNKAFSNGYSCDNFIVNGVRYIHVDAEKPGTLTVQVGEKGKEVNRVVRSKFLLVKNEEDDDSEWFAIDEIPEYVEEGENNGELSTQ